ncbi:uncharacterized protein LOC112566941 [Pomacea canaliculata]|uniref:uncharacterized protein LOC112566941 n=1 Tax=Pomacea canaliculata TaxID=400727 RepID=UPI000D7313FB|nr:uncharacterized protein LOC112566941 [Pomacea canaliculata]
MWTTMILPLMLLCVLSCLHAQNSDSAPSQQVQLQSNGMDYALFGYNSLKGCPLTLTHDPGFTLPIFSAEVTGDNGGPRGVGLTRHVSCVTSFTSTVVETPYELTKLMAVTAQLGADEWGPPFSASQDFKKFSAELKQNVLVFSTAVCSIYHVNLLLWELPSFRSSFLEWIIKLNNTDDEDMYLKFLDTYGTHFVSRARFGASITVVHKMEDKVYRRLTEGHVRSAASYVAAELFGQPQTLTSDQQKAANEFRNKVETTTVTVGVSPPYAGNSLTWFTAAEDQPSAIHYHLTSVEVLFSDTLMGNSSLIGSYGINHVRIRNNIVAVKTKYCWTLKGEDLIGECEGSSSKTLLSTKLMELLPILH